MGFQKGAQEYNAESFHHSFIFPSFLQLFPRLAAPQPTAKEEITPEKLNRQQDNIQFLQCGGILSGKIHLSGFQKGAQEYNAESFRHSFIFPAFFSYSLNQQLSANRQEEITPKGSIDSLSSVWWNSHLFPKLAALSQPLKEEITPKSTKTVSSSVVEFIVSKYPFSKGVSRRSTGIQCRIISSLFHFSCFLQLFPRLAALSQPLKEEITPRKAQQTVSSVWWNSHVNKYPFKWRFKKEHRKTMPKHVVTMSFFFLSSVIL
ncbi:hypothetical protein AVEN_41931-1 [Araneus ventricosus]|uniref:Uncharacterized protein n=1 Tax=Araneus ventricosus TaxID=182803 RepID=A0A4Y2AD99_ARAVE|nr:hypothetical protein AVEN_41931-1 [Araneus ventricosus]